MRWPAAWNTPESLNLLNDTPINCLLLDTGADLGLVATQARQRGLAVTAAQPMGVKISKGEWPGVAIDSGGGATAGPTGVPWLNSNGWKIRLENALYPDLESWIDAPPKAARISPEAFAVAFTDAAACGGRWIITLDEGTAARIASGHVRSLDGWKKLGAAVRFFDARKQWAEYQPEAVVGVVSDFAGENEFLSGETLNLLARTNQQYRVIVKGKASEESWKGLRAILYLDAQPPTSPLRTRIEGLVKGGLMLIAGPKWGAVSGVPAKDQEHPRYEIRVVGRGKVGIAKATPDDPYVLANDSVVLVSHRYELLRFFNVGTVNSLLTAAADRKSFVLQMQFYTNRGPRDASVRIAGNYRSARLWTPDRDDARDLEVKAGRDGVEVHLPPLEQYAAVELEI